MQINRLFEMVYLLLQREKLTAKELAERFEVSVRTIYRDVDLLSGSGIPVYASRGRGGGVHLLPEFVLNKSVLSEQEQNEILFALQTMKVTGAEEGGQVIGRLSALFQKNGGDWIDVDFSSWGSGPEAKAVFQLLKAGILSRRVVTFSYFSSYGIASLRRVEPVKLRFKHGSWYLQGFCLEKGAFRTFKISRMEAVELTEEECRAGRGPVPELEGEKDQWASGAPGVSMVRLKLRFAPKTAFRVYDEFDHRQIAKERDGSLLVEIGYPMGEWVYSYLLSFGDGLEVLEPEQIRKGLGEQARIIARRYDEKILAAESEEEKRMR